MRIRIANAIDRGDSMEILFKVTNDDGFIKIFKGLSSDDNNVVESAWNNVDQDALYDFLEKSAEEPGKVVGKYYNPATGKVEDTPASDRIPPDPGRPTPPDPDRPTPPEPDRPNPPGPNNPNSNKETP